ncbi:MAG: SMP-30/gluconolactonase/LRE family protein [Chlamydiae bacterium]|nr:SMP-30/gluconolactonase/LRE family protein [Chlamydiota bacterium]
MDMKNNDQSNGLQCVFRGNDILGESPVWSSIEQRLYWVDILGQKIHRFSPSTSEYSFIKMDQPIAAIGIGQDGTLLGALRKSLAIIDWNTGGYQVIAELELDKPNNRFNDGKCDRLGRLWVGTMDSISCDRPHGALYKIERDLTIHQMVTDVSCANGIGWSPDNSIMYFTESLKYSIFAYDYNLELGKISNRRVFAKLNPDAGGVPDGLTVDAEGYVWSAQYGASQVVRYSPQGEVDLIVKLPVPRPTSCAFGGKNLDTLFFTTATENLTKEQITQYPLSGSLFAISTQTKGILEPSWVIDNLNHINYNSGSQGSIEEGTFKKRDIS